MAANHPDRLEPISNTQGRVSVELASPVLAHGEAREVEGGYKGRRKVAAMLSPVCIQGTPTSERGVSHSRMVSVLRTRKTLHLPQKGRRACMMLFRLLLDALWLADWV